MPSSDPFRRFRFLAPFANKRPAAEAPQPSAPILTTNEEWARAFAGFRQLEDFEVMVPEQARFLREQIDLLTAAPEAVASFDSFTRRPTLAAVEVVARLVEYEEHPNYCERILGFALARHTLAELVPTFEEHTARVRHAMTPFMPALQRIAESSELQNDPGVQAEMQQIVGSLWGEISSTGNLLLQRAIRITTETSVAGLVLTPRDVMAWLVRETPEGQALVDHLRESATFERWMKPDGDLQDLWTRLEPGVAGVLMRAVANDTPPPPSQGLPPRSL